MEKQFVNSLGNLAGGSEEASGAPTRGGGASTRLGAALLAWLIAISTVTGSAAASAVTAATHSLAAHSTSADSPSAMSWLSVSHGSGAGPQIVDAQGRTVVLRGVNLVGLEDDVYLTASGQEPGPAPRGEASIGSEDHPTRDALWRRHRWLIRARTRRHSPLFQQDRP